jgi:hypothetical protein
MPRKVMFGKETMQAAGTVTKKLAKWLAAQGYLKDTEDAQERAGAAGKDLPNATAVLALLSGYGEIKRKTILSVPVVARVAGRRCQEVSTPASRRGTGLAGVV